MDAIDTALLDTVCADLLAEAGRIACQRLRKLVFGQDGVDEFTDHGMLAGADEVEILALDFVHHIFHFRKAHDPVYHIPANHKRRNIVGKATVYHKIARIG